MIKVLKPTNNSVQQQFKTLKAILSKDDEKNRQNHLQAINDFKKHLITQEIEVTQKSINFHRQTITSYKDDVDKLKNIKGFEEFVDYKLNAIAKMESNLIALENDIIKLEGEKEMLKTNLERVLTIREKELVDFTKCCIELNDEWTGKLGNKTDIEILEELDSNLELYQYIEDMLTFDLNTWLDEYNEEEPDADIEKEITRYETMLCDLSSL